MARRFCSFVLAVAAVAPLVPVLGGQQAAASVRARATLTGSHITLPSGRTYWLTGAVGGTTPRALVVGLTFSGHDAAWLDDAAWVTGNAATAGWHQHAAGAGYTLALAEPVDGGWNVGTGTNDPNPGGWPGSGQDDVGYLLQLVADASVHTPVDPARVFIAGGSAGGALAWRMAADHPEVVSACAMAAGWVPYRYPVHPMDCRHDHGTGDVTVPIRGGVGVGGYRFPAAYEEMVRAPRGSRVALYATSAGHAVPGWWAGAVWGFFTTGRGWP
jgi:poly(3-hydroxybutyrate) depolymerase